MHEQVVIMQGMRFLVQDQGAIRASIHTYLMVDSTQLLALYCLRLRATHQYKYQQGAAGVRSHTGPICRCRSPSTHRRLLQAHQELA